jgi:hypothetical protein
VAEFADETLMAYADGELAAAERAYVESAVAADPRVAERLAIFVETRKALTEEFGNIAKLKVPPHLLATINCAPPRLAAAPAPSRTARRGLYEMLALPAWIVWTPALAAAALAALLIGRQGPATTPQPQESARFADTALTAALDHQLMPEPTAAPTDVRIVYTFRSKAGTYCRQYERHPEAKDMLQGIACREGGVWRIEAEAAAPPAPAARPGGLLPAGGDEAPVVTETFNRLRDGDALGPEQEQELVAKGFPLGKAAPRPETK